MKSLNTAICFYDHKKQKKTVFSEKSYLNTMQWNLFTSSNTVYHIGYFILPYLSKTIKTNYFIKEDKIPSKG